MTERQDGSNSHAVVMARAQNVSNSRTVVLTEGQNVLNSRNVVMKEESNQQYRTPKGVSVINNCDEGRHTSLIQQTIH